MATHDHQSGPKLQPPTSAVNYKGPSYVVPRMQREPLRHFSFIQNYRSSRNIMKTLLLRIRSGQAN